MLDYLQVIASVCCHVQELQRPTPAPGNKLMQLLADNNLTQHVHETTRQNNILDLVLSTEEELIIVNLKITDKIGDHQAITFSIKTEKGI